jgi:hypothetical protein
MPSPSASGRSHRPPRRPRIGAGAGGCDFLEDPRKTGLEAFVFWRADALARLVRLAPAPEGLAAGSLIRYEPERWGSRQAGGSTPDGYHLILAPAPGIEHHLVFRDPDPPPLGAALMPLLSFDAWHPERLAATLAFWRFAQNPRSSPAAPIKTPKPSAKALEAAFLVWALDLDRAGNSTRGIARALFDEAAPDWEKHRTFGTGPTYRKIGGRVVYRVEDLQRWADQGLRVSTSDPGIAQVRVPKPVGR